MENRMLDGRPKLCLICETVQENCDILDHIAAHINYRKYMCTEYGCFFTCFKENDMTAHLSRKKHLTMDRRVNPYMERVVMCIYEDFQYAELKGAEEVYKHHFDYHDELTRFIDGRENSKQSDIKEVEVSVGSSYNQASLQNIEKNKNLEITPDFIHNICTYNKHNYDSESTPTRTPPKRIHEPNVVPDGASSISLNPPSKLISNKLITSSTRKKTAQGHSQSHQTTPTIQQLPTSNFSRIRTCFSNAEQNQQSCSNQRIHLTEQNHQARDRSRSMNYSTKKDTKQPQRSRSRSNNRIDRTFAPETLKCHICKSEVNNDHIARKNHVINIHLKSARIEILERQLPDMIEHCFKEQGCFLATQDIQCQICGYSVKTRAVRESHVSKAHTTYEWNCPICLPNIITVRSLEELNKHIISTHQVSTVRHLTGKAKADYDTIVVDFHEKIQEVYEKCYPCEVIERLNTPVIVQNNEKRHRTSRYEPADNTLSKFMPSQSEDFYLPNGQSRQLASPKLNSSNLPHSKQCKKNRLSTPHTIGTRKKATGPRFQKGAYNKRKNPIRRTESNPKNSKNLQENGTTRAQSRRVQVRQSAKQATGTTDPVLPIQTYPTWHSHDIEARRMDLANTRISAPEQEPASTYSVDSIKKDEELQCIYID